MALRRRILSEDAECSHDGRSCVPPSPLPPPPPPPWPPSTRIHINNKNHALTLVVVVAAAVLAVCLLSVACYAVHRYLSSRRRRRAAAALTAAWGPPQPPSDDLLREDLLVVGGGGGGGEEPYHVWYIRTAGLEEAVIGAIAVWEYKKGEGVVEGTDCAVCLGEFAQGERLRLLPKCSHAFHAPCIDTWLRSHVNCPLCRAPVLSPAPQRGPPPPPLPSPAARGEVAVALVQSTQNSGGSEEVGNWNSAVSPPAEVAGDRPPSEDSFSSEVSEIWVPIDLGDGGLGDEEVASYAAPEERDVDRELQPVRRSMSMDSSPALAGLLLRTRLAGSSRDADGRKPCCVCMGGNASSTDKKGGTGENKLKAKGVLLIDAPLEMERSMSMSMSGGRFFLSRFSGRARGAILPL